MTEPKDKQRPRKPVFDRDDGFSGQEYHIDDERRLAADMPAGSVHEQASQVAVDDTPPPADNGRRASFDPATGAVRGSGASAGGGNEGEDLASDSAAGDGPPVTGKRR